jgi:PRTRC genetic system protein A
VFANLVTYHIHQQEPLPASDALAYQYILAGNGLFVRAETRFFTAVLLAAACTVRGLAPLRRQFRLKCPRLPAQLLHAVLADGRRARQPDGRLNETLYQFHHHGRTVQVRKPAQQGTATSVIAAGGDAPAVVCDLHSHGHMPAFFSPTDDADEQGLRLYAVMGRLDSVPEMRLRLGVCGYWQPLPLTAVFSDAGPFLDLYNFKERER